MDTKKLLLSVGITSLLLLSAEVSAQGSAGTETLQVPLGEIFEIQAALNTGDSISWILTRNGEFVSSGRKALFQTRFAQEGQYVLSAEVLRNGLTIQRVFSVDVAPSVQLPRSTDSGDIVMYTPSPNSISEQVQVLTVTPVHTDVKVLAFDLNTQVDSNNDGNPENDEDTKETLFRTAQNPLRIWFVGGQKTTIRFGALLSNNQTVFTPVAVGNGATVQPKDPTTPPLPDDTSSTTGEMQIQVLRNDNGEVTFVLDSGDVDTPLLLLWNFGDGAQSMLDSPVHTYSSSDRYSVSVEVRNLETGEVLETVEERVRVDIAKETAGVEGGEGGEGTDRTGSAESTEGGGSAILGIVIKIVLSLVVFGAIGALIMFIVGLIKKKGFSLEKTMERAEEVMVKPPSADSVNPPPMEIVAEEVETEGTEDAEGESNQESEIGNTQSTPTPEPPTPTPTPSPSPTSDTPEWLSGGLQGVEEDTEKRIEDKEEDAPKTEEATSEPSPNPSPSPSPSPTPSPEPKVEVAENVAHDAMEPKAEELKTETTNAPDWLQAGIQKAEAEGQTPDAPPPPTLQDASPPSPSPSPNPTPDWLTAAEGAEAKEGAEESSGEQETTAQPQPSPSPSPNPNPTPDWLNAGTEEESNQSDEAERERKRRKRQRYRENVKKRKEGEGAEGIEEDSGKRIEDSGENPDEPVAFVKAEDIEPMEQPKPPQEPTPPPPPLPTDS